MSKVWMSNGYPHGHPYHGQVHIDEESVDAWNDIIKQNRRECMKSGGYYKALIELEDARSDIERLSYVNKVM